MRMKRIETACFTVMKLRSCDLDKELDEYRHDACRLNPPPPPPPPNIHTATEPEVVQVLDAKGHIQEPTLEL